MWFQERLWRPLSLSYDREMEKKLAKGVFLEHYWLTYLKRLIVSRMILL